MNYMTISYFTKLLIWFLSWSFTSCSAVTDGINRLLSFSEKEPVYKTIYDIKFYDHILA